MFHKVVNTVLFVGASLAVEPGGGMVGTADAWRGPCEGLRVILGEKASSVERRAAELFVAEVKRRTGLEVPIGGNGGAKRSLVVGTPESNAAIQDYGQQHAAARSLEPDGFHLATAPDDQGRIYLVGQSPSGVVAGIGKLLRLSRYADGAMEIPPLTLTDHPHMPVRGMYFATHFGNFYHVAPVEEVDRLIEDLALWGANELVVWFDMHHYESLQDPAAQQQLARLKHFGETAHGLGMRFGLVFVANEAYNTSPKHLRASQVVGNLGPELCPSKPEALALLGQWQAELLDAFRPSPGVDLIWCWPYDSGGCSCEQCKPWGGRGFLRASEQLARLYRERFPQGQVWLSAWCFDLFCGDWGDHDRFFQYVREKKPTWFEGIITGTYSGDGIQRRLLQEHPAPERYPLANFPEISMHTSPWGGYGADPLPEYNTRFAHELRPHIVGGWPYSEGIYEDVSKFFWVQFYWNPDRTTDDIHAGYASYYLGPEWTEEAVRLFRLLEKANAPHRHGLRPASVSEADEAWALAQAMDARLPGWARTSWRWRIIHARAAIDHLVKTMGYVTPEARSALEPLRDELARLYHGNWVFQLPPPPDPANLAYGRPVTASSTLPEYEGSVQTLVDGIRAEYDDHNFWVHDPAREKTAWVRVDLGQSVPIKEVRLQFRNISGKYWFILESVSFAVSEDGEDFATVLVSKEVPVEGAEYSPRLWVYAIGKAGRYLRVNLGPSQHVGDPYAGTLELTEIEVFGP